MTQLASIARRHLETDFSLVGTSERLDEFQALLSIKLGITKFKCGKARDTDTLLQTQSSESPERFFSGPRIHSHRELSGILMTKLAITLRFDFDLRTLASELMDRQIEGIERTRFFSALNDVRDQQHCIEPKQGPRVRAPAASCVAQAES